VDANHLANRFNRDAKHNRCGYFYDRCPRGTPVAAVAPRKPRTTEVNTTQNPNGIPKGLESE